jgi:hypothetical protein
MVRGTVLAALFWICSTAMWAREPAQVALKWEDLGGRIGHKKVAFVLPDGTRVAGKAIAVEPEGLRLKVTQSSDRRIQPKGRQLVPRQSISVIRVTEYRKMGRLLGTLGAAALAGGIAAAAYPDLYEGTVLIVVPAVVAGGIAGSAVAGYYIGKSFDRHVTEIRIVPDAAR